MCLWERPEAMVPHRPRVSDAGWALGRIRHRSHRTDSSLISENQGDLARWSLLNRLNRGGQPEVSNLPEVSEQQCERF